MDLSIFSDSKIADNDLGSMLHGVDMEAFVKLAWILLALIHAAPAAAAFSPSLIRTLYGVEPSGDIGVLLAHRGVLFLGVALLCLFAAITREARRAACAMTTLSVSGFLFLYIAAGSPSGSLRTIAIADAAALVPLALAARQAFFRAS